MEVNLPWTSHIVDQQGGPSKQKDHQVVGWTNPFEKYYIVKMGIFPNFQGETKKYLSCHHPESYYCW